MTMPTSARARHGAFTLMELLVVVSIIGLLASMLLPAIQLVRESAKRVVCAGRQRSIATALNAYANDNEGSSPHIGHTQMTVQVDWEGVQKLGCLLEQGFLEKSRDVLNCPGRSRRYDSTLTAYVESGYAFLHPTNVPATSDSFNLASAQSGQYEVATRIMPMPVMLACRVDDGPLTPDAQQLVDLPHRGEGVEFGRIDGSVGFYRSPIRLWPGYYWAPLIPSGNSSPYDTIWQTLQAQ